MPLPISAYDSPLIAARAGDPYGDFYSQAARALVVDARDSVKTVAIVPTAVNDFLYSIGLNGLTPIEYQADASATKAEIAAGLLAAHRADPLNNAIAEMSVDGSNNLLLTGREPGFNFAVALSANLAATVTAATTPAAIPYGAIIAPDPADGQVGIIPGASDLPGSIWTITPTAANDTRYTYQVSVEDVGSFPLSMLSDASATVKEIVDALTLSGAPLAAHGIVVSDDDSVLTLTGGAGVKFRVDLVEDGAATSTITQTQQGVAINDLDARVNIRVASTAPGRTGGVDGRAAGEIMSAMRVGWVVPEDDPADLNAPVYYRHTVSGDTVIGAVRASAATGCILWSKARWRKLGDSLAVIEIQ